MCYLSLPFYVTGLIISGAAFQQKLPIVAIVMGWGIREVAVMTTTAACCTFLLSCTKRSRSDASHITRTRSPTPDSYCSDCFPRYHGEVSGLLNLFRSLGGFAVPYFQTSWARKHGAMQVFGCEAA